MGCRDGDLELVTADARLELACGAFGDDGAVVDHRDPVGERVGLVEVLRGEHDGRAVGHQAAHDLPHALPARRVEAGGRLVEEQDRRARHQAGGEVEPAAHAARVGLHHAPGGVGEVEALEQLGRPHPRLLAGQARQLADQHQVLGAGEQLVERGVLPGHADHPADGRRLAGDVEPGDPAGAGVGRRHRGEHADGGRLPGAVGPEDAEDASGRHLEVDPVDRHLLAVDLAEALGLDHRSVNHGGSSRGGVSFLLVVR